MEKIFYADKSAYTTEAALKKILSDYYKIDNSEILRTENGKPYINGGPYFSVTHTKNRLYIAFSNEEIGLDAESLLRAPYYETIVQKFSKDEQAEIRSTEDFLKHWVVKEFINYIRFFNCFNYIFWRKIFNYKINSLT